jgi:hypothetical protein
MFGVDRTVIGSKRRRWHPVNPFQMKRHGDTLISLRRRRGSGVFVSQSWKWLTERMARSPQGRLVFDDGPPQLTAPTGNFEGW